MKRLCFIACGLSFAATAFAAPFQNGSFELGAPVSPCFQENIGAGSSVGPGWTVSVGNIDWNCFQDLNGLVNWQAPQGNYSLDLIGGMSIGGVQQTFDTLPGRTYRVTFQLAGNPSTLFPPPIKPLTVTVAGITQNYTFDVTGHTVAQMGWTPQTFDFVANSTSSTINFVSDMQGTTSTFAGAAIDDVAVTLIPPTPTLLGVIVSPTDATASIVIGRVEGVPNTTMEIYLYRAPTCTGGAFGSEEAGFGPFGITTDAQGYFILTPPLVGLENGQFVWARFGVSGVPFPLSEPSNCLISSPDNDTWPKAFELTGSPASVSGYIDAPGKARWYKFSVIPGQRIDIALSNLPADYDLAVFKDIGTAFVNQLPVNTTTDLAKLGAEYAPSVFSPSVFSPSVFSPSVFSPDAYAPSVFSPSVFSPSVFSPSVFSPSVFSPSVFSPSVFSPSVFSPSVFSPSVFSPSVFSTSAVIPSVFSPEEIAQAFSNAQTRSLIAVSATPGRGNETVTVNTWNNTGSFYVRVAGRSGAYSTSGPFTIGVVKDGMTCANVNDTTLTPRTPVDRSGLKTLVLTDSSKVNLDAPLPGGETLRLKLIAFMARPEIAGTLIDVAPTLDPRVGELKLQAASHAECPFAKNLVAQEIKGIVDSYRPNNPNLRYVLIVGNDDAIPFFRYPDQSLIGQESGYFPPMTSTSASEASLRRDYVLSQDAYGSTQQISVGVSDFPIPGLAVGRLVENPADMAGLLDAYTTNTNLTSNGVVAPRSSLVTGYDFLQDAADAVKSELGQGTGTTPDTLITANGISPEDPASWNVIDLRQKLLGSRHDVIFLAGHFSANSMLAADFKTSLITTELLASSVDLTNAVVFSAGCHAGYNIVDADAIDGVTLKLAWPEAFAQKKATLVAGTGYQYGDTDFLEYSERLYNHFARQLRTGTGPVSVGEALARAKRDYLAATPDIRGLHQKALLEATVYGLPMLGVNMPGARIPNPAGAGAVTPVAVTAPGPGATLGLKTFDLPSISPALQTIQKTLTLVPGPGTVTATYLKGPDGVVTNPAEPALPLVNVNVTPTDSTVALRGVGFRGGSYADSTGIVPLTGSPTTELRGVHVPFLSQAFYPMRLATPNYYGVLSGSGGTNLLVTPAQHRAFDVSLGTSTLRKFTSLNLRLYYSGLTEGDTRGDAVLSDAPTIVHADAMPAGAGATFSAQVVGDPAAGIHEVWVTYTGGAGGTGTWTSLNLAQCVAPLPAACGTTVDSKLWKGQATSLPGSAKYVVQAVNAVGLVSLDDNLGSYYSVAAAAPVATSIAFIGTVPSTAAFGDSPSVSVTLASGGLPLAGKAVTLSVGGSTQIGTTDGAGSVTVNVPVIATPAPTPGFYSLTASFAGDEAYLPSAVSTPFSVTKAPTQLTLSSLGTGAVLTASIGTPPKTQPLIQETIRFSVTGPQGPQEIYAITDYRGFAKIPPPGLPLGAYTVTQAHFPGNATYDESALSLTGTFVSPAYQFVGFFQPVDNHPVLNKLKAGQSVPVKFSLGANMGLDVFAPGYPLSQSIGCQGFTGSDAIEEMVTATIGGGLQYDSASNVYTYVWKTDKAWASTCRVLVLAFKDGSQVRADFNFTK